MRPKQTKEEINAKKRQRERLRIENIKSDPDLYAQWQVKQREKYLKRKMMGKIVPISQLPPKKQKIMRKKSRESSNRYNAKKKMKAGEQQVYCENLHAKAKEDEDPLRISTPPPSLDISVTNSPTTSVNCNNQNMVKSTKRATIKYNNKLIDNQREDNHSDGPTPITSAVSSNENAVTRITRSTISSINYNNKLIDNQREDNHSDGPTPTTSAVSSNENAVTRMTRSTISSPQDSFSDTSSVQVSSTSPVRRVKRLSAKKTSPWRHLLRTFRYRSNKEIQIKNQKISELKNLTEKYRKQIKRLQKDLHRNGIRGKYAELRSGKETKNDILVKSKDHLKKNIEAFLEEDDNSRLSPGKKEYITRHKIRKQKRYLTDTLHNLHSKFLQLHPQYDISYSFFCTFRPFWILVPSVNIRETCLCKVHENMDLVVMALKRNDVINENSAFQVLKSLCCDPRSVSCLTKKCNLCKNKQLNYKEFDNSSETYYWIWNKTKKTYVKNGKDRVTMQTVKDKVVAHPKDIIEYFENIIGSYMKHCANIAAQSGYIKKIKANLKADQCIIHCDFSENYNTKYSSEIQSFHFGSSRQQITLHTSVIYYKKNGENCVQSFCTLSESLRHDAAAVWEHLLPILAFIEDTVPEVKSLYFISDSPSAQYRNRKMFYIMAKLHWHYPSLVSVVWNYTESGHGKGAPDGVGGVLKRTADQIVARGNDIQNIECLVDHLKKTVTAVILKVIQESGIFEKDLLIPPDLKEFRGTMNVHQVVWNSNNASILAMRTLSCDIEDCLDESVECIHGKHIGFYHIGSTHPETSNRKKTRMTSKNIRKDSSLIHTRLTHDDVAMVVNNTHTSMPKQGNRNKFTTGDNSNNQIESFNLPDNDSFWAEISSIDEEVITPTLTDTVLDIIQQEKRDDLNNTVKSMGKDDDLEIFD